MKQVIVPFICSLIWFFSDFMIGKKFSEESVEKGGINIYMVLVAYSAHIVGRFLGSGFMFLLCPEWFGR